MNVKKKPREEHLGRVNNCAFIIYGRLVYGKPIPAEDMDAEDRRGVRKVANFIEHWTGATAYYHATQALLNSSDYADDRRPLMEALRKAHGYKS